MRAVFAIGVHTVREHLRDKLYWNLLAFGLLMLGCALLLPRLTVGEAHRIVIDVGLAGINLVGTLIAMLLGVTLVSRDIDRRTVYLLVARPFSRGIVLAGKYLGLCATMLMNLAMMAAGFVVVLWIMEVPITAALAQSLGAIGLECLVMTAVALMASSCTTVTLGVMLTCGWYVAGHSLATLRTVADKTDGFSATAVSVLTYLFPNLELFNLKGQAVYGQTLDAVDLALRVGYAAAYSALLVGVAMVIFQRRDLA